MTRTARAALCLTALAAACRRDPEVIPASPSPPAPASDGSGAAAAAPTDAGAPECSELPFAATTPVPEASGAAWLTLGPGGAGKLGLLVISDSGNDGAYVIVDADSGATVEQGKLPLGGPGEDLEGVAVRGGRFHVISSPGWIRSYERRAGAASGSAPGFALVDGPYPLGPIDLTDQGSRLGNEPPKGNGMVCAAANTNCGRNYEGLCLAPGPVSGRCVGFAAAKADGHLYCLVESGGRLSVEYTQSIKITRPGALADCAFSDDGRLYAGSNMFDASNVYRVTGWDDPARAKVTRLGPLPVGFPETLAVRGDVFYRMSDTGGAPSAMKKYRCPGW